MHSDILLCRIEAVKVLNYHQTGFLALQPGFFGIHSPFTSLKRFGRYFQQMVEVPYIVYLSKNSGSHVLAGQQLHDD